MYRLLADHAEHLAVPADEAQPLPDQHLGIPAADRLDVGVALVVDVRDDHADLVDVAGQHDRRFALSVHFSDAIAGDIAANFCELARLVAPDLGWSGLEAGWSGRIEQRSEEHTS